MRLGSFPLARALMGVSWRRLERQHGFTLMMMLAAMTVLALMTQGVMWVLSQQNKRLREEELLRIGQSYVQAIASYYESSPGNTKAWPRDLDDLVEDQRFVGTRRHIRELYADPVTREFDWQVISSVDGGIQGLHSRAAETPLRDAPTELPIRLGLDSEGRRRVVPLPLNKARSYSDWRFIYEPVPEIR